MSASNKGLADEKDTKINLLDKATTLNPNAAEFVPSALKYARSTKSSDVKKLDDLGASRNAVLDQLGSTTSNNSEDEANQYWHHQLPDDITPDFSIMEDKLQRPGHHPIAALSIHDTVGPSRFSGPMANQISGVSKEMSSFTSKNHSSSGKVGCSGSAYAKQQSSTTFTISAANSWGKPCGNGEQISVIGREAGNKNGNFSGSSVNDLISDNMFLENAIVDSIEYLTSHFPGFAAQRLANVYYQNGCDLNSTIELLTQYKHEIGSDFSQNLNSNPLATPRLSRLDCTPIPMADAPIGLSKYTGEDIKHSPIMHRSNSVLSRGDMDFALTNGQLALQDSGHRDYGISGYADGGVRSSRTNSFYGDKGATRLGAVWLDAGEAVEPRREDRDFANLHNAYFEKANQAYLIGNKAFAKELSPKGQLYNMQMKAKAACEKTKGAINRQRNTSSPELLRSCSPVPAYLITLYGFHVTEAIDYLNRELNILQSKARSSRQPLHAIICLGIGQHTKGTQTSSARLLVAVEQYLLEKGLYFTEPQPDLVRVVVY